MGRWSLQLLLDCFVCLVVVVLVWVFSPRRLKRVNTRFIRMRENKAKSLIWFLEVSYLTSNFYYAWLYLRSETIRASPSKRATSLPWSSSSKPLHTIQKTTLVPTHYFQVSLSWSIILTFIICHNITEAIQVTKGNRHLQISAQEQKKGCKTGQIWNSRCYKSRHLDLN